MGTTGEPGQFIGMAKMRQPYRSIKIQECGSTMAAIMSLESCPTFST